jgi:hypothetical protein
MDLSAYFAGFVDGEGCFTVSFSPRSTLLLGWEVRPSFSVSQNADRIEVWLLMQAFKVRQYSTRPKRQNAEVRSALPRRSRRAHHSVLRGQSVDFQQAERFRMIRPGLQTGACWGTSEQARSSRNRGNGCEDEPFRQTQVCDRSDLPTGAEVIVSAISNDG